MSFNLFIKSVSWQVNKYKSVFEHTYLFDMITISLIQFAKVKQSFYQVISSHFYQINVILFKNQLSEISKSFLIFVSLSLQLQLSQHVQKQVIRNSKTKIRKISIIL